MSFAKIYSKIVSSGSYLPENIVTNNELAIRLAKDNIETSDEWIRERTGICSRAFANKEQKSSDLAVIAAQRALANGNINVSEIDLIIIATSTPDNIFPSTACIVQQKLGMGRATSFDIQAVCSGFVYALTVADSLIKSGANKKALVIGAETFSGILNFHDRTTCVLFGDGAGAMILSAETDKKNDGIIDCEICADGNYNQILNVSAQVRQGEICGNPFIKMDGQTVFKLAVTVLSEVAQKILIRQNIKISDINWIIPHQANIRIMSAINKKLGAEESQLISTVANHANTSAASIPLAFDESVNAGKISRGDKVLLLGVGGGFTWGGVLLNY